MQIKCLCSLGVCPLPKVSFAWFETLIFQYCTSKYDNPFPTPWQMHQNRNSTLLAEISAQFLSAPRKKLGFRSSMRERIAQAVPGIQNVSLDSLHPSSSTDSEAVRDLEGRNRLPSRLCEKDGEGTEH